jgi:hypothetical protein
VGTCKPPGRSRERSERGCSPDGNLVQQVILQLQFLHLTISHGSIFAFQEILLHFVPWPIGLALESDFDPVRTKDENEV